MRDAPDRILLKLSGGILGGSPPGAPLSTDTLLRLAQQIAHLEVEVGVVMGGGNILRGGRSGWSRRVEADAVGMMATVVNALALGAFLTDVGQGSVVQSAVNTELTQPISVSTARTAMANGDVVIFAGGTGNPLVTTDTAAAIRGASIEADLLAKGSNVSGVYPSDPATKEDSTVDPMSEMSYKEFLRHEYGVMDLVAVQLCEQYSLPVVVFDMEETGALEKVASGEPVGTLIH